MKGGGIWSRLWRWIWRSALALGLLGALALGFAYVSPAVASRGRLFKDPSAVPAGRVGLVFGCTDRVDGRENLYFRYRIEAAVKLWQAGKIRCLIVSGDNRERYYNEPETMRRALIAQGVPAERIVKDYAGLRTLDSVVRAKEVFDAGEVVFISQRFQNERAIYLARANGIDAVGFNARDVPAHGGWKTKLREVGARVKMWLDVHVLGTRPRHLGPRVALPE